MKNKVLFASFVSILALLVITDLAPAWDDDYNYPETAKIAVRDTLHGVEIIDNYRWLENAENPEVVAWTKEQESLTHSILDTLPQREFLIKRFNELLRYDDEDVPDKVLDGERIFLWTKKKDEEKWVYNTRAREDAELEELINPNLWDPTETLADVVPSRDGKYVAFGKAHGGDENPIYLVMVVETGEILPDSLLGWKQRVSSWLPENSGFYYTANPLKGEVPEGEENYWQSVYFHKLGTPPSEDKKIFFHNTVKEYWHDAAVTEDGKYVVFYRSIYNQNEVYFKRVGSDEPLIPITTSFDAQYSVDIIEGKILIRTDKDAPLYKVYITDVDKPDQQYWREFIPEDSNDMLQYIACIAGHVYAVYQHNAYTRVKIFTLEGKYLRELSFPTIGTANLTGYWSQPDVWVKFSSFTYPSTIYRYDFGNDSLILYRKYPVEIDVSNFTTEQVWYKSKDGTPISMFLVHHKDLKKDGNNPTLLTAYGGFNISITPRFSTSKVVWLEAGGMVAIPNLRGGGEYGQEWHKAGMLEKKQNVFDDFIAAAEWLIDNGYTNPDKLAISGGSNGGLLVGAATVQRPELFKVVDCAVPLLDMIRYHKFGYANVWAEEYGSSDNPEQFKYLYRYSPYHNVINGVKYPAMIITGSENDARVDPLHARKMVARLQEANPHGEPILLLVQKASGHHGGTTLSVRIEQQAQTLAFLMQQLGMNAPE